MRTANWLGTLVLLVAIATTTPLNAERLSFDHRLYPPLKASLDSRNGNLTHFDDRNPRYIYNLIVVQGTSYDDWTEGLEIVTRLAGRNMTIPRDWLSELQARRPRQCAEQIAVITEDSQSITFERRLSGCRAAIAQSGLYRIVAGKRSLFLLGALNKGEIGAEMRTRWLELLASAKLTG